MSIGFNDYDVRVWDDGKVRINSHDPIGIYGHGHLAYKQGDGASLLLCDTNEGDMMYKAVKLACMDAAAAMRALDETLRAVG